ncbi:MAG: efflux RND transporter periplasmic adaptor subunit [Lachnospiraceae bacterium]|nr:efflux RND transporter periplasmic adaptor subunit [Lachnospiraceae bacterium]
MKKKKIIKIVIPITVVVLIAGAAALNKAASAGRQIAEAMQVEGIKAETGDVTEVVETNGTVISGEQKVIFSPVNASVESADFQVGDLVNAGDLLVTFGLKDLEEQNQKAELTVKAGELGYQDSVSQANRAASRQADARNKAAQLQAQVNAKEQEVANLSNALAGTISAQEASRQQEENHVNGQIADLQEQLETAKEQEASAKASYEKAVSSQQSAQVNFDAAAAAASSEPEKLDDAREKLNKANKELADAKNNYEAKQQEAASLEQQIGTLQGTLSAPGTDIAAGDPNLQQQLQNAQGELAELKANLESQKAMAEGDSGALSSAAREQMLTNNNLAELESKSLEELIAEGRKGISADFDGVISDKQIMEGAMVTQGMQLFTLQSIEDVNVEVTLSKNVYAKVKEGQKAEITLAGQTYQGTVKRISRIAIDGAAGTNQAAVASAAIMATIHIDNADEDIFLGVDAKVKIQAAEAKNVLILPTEAVNIGKDGTFCWVDEDGVLTKRSITTGVTSDEYAEITQGLDEGETVITDPGSHEEGDSITVTEAEDDAAAGTEDEPGTDAGAAGTDSEQEEGNGAAGTDSEQEESAGAAAETSGADVTAE